MGLRFLSFLLCIAITGHSVSARLTEQQRADLLNQHNHARSNAEPKPCGGLRPMQWDDELARIAQQYANRCQYRHNDQRTKAQTKYRYVGENLHVTATINADPKEGVVGWENEKVDYDIRGKGKPDDIMGNCKPGKQCGHYTQIVWNSTLHVGCGLSVCNTKKTGLNWDTKLYPKVQVLVCNYEGGNIRRQSPYKYNCPKPKPAVKQAPSAPAQKPASLKRRHRLRQFELPHEMQDAITQAHNTVRRNAPHAETKLRDLNDPEYIKNNARQYRSLQTSAYANARRCVYNVRKHSVLGFNRFVSANTSATPLDAIKHWAAEGKHYNVRTKKSINMKGGVRGECDAGKSCSSYTQLVWRQTKLVACHQSRCTVGTANMKHLPTLSGVQNNRVRLVICAYYKKGNRSNKGPYRFT